MGSSSTGCGMRGTCVSTATASSGPRLDGATGSVTGDAACHSSQTTEPRALRGLPQAAVGNYLHGYLGAGLTLGGTASSCASCWAFEFLSVLAHRGRELAGATATSVFRSASESSLNFERSSRAALPA